eukprot:NODE_5776_length_677_cov_8.302548_g4885_i0.p3 GENE.NODE_5776_length_677_cov_8.302548_g4885_i0~~NODE_5776_length_677_cov_8.302548_g4885_i0.p3  ORF type:complete len:50 (+),score=0.14 NODE_5776_length_677_cov_8.302548_g4885_i0:310-459(+)
MVQQLSSSLAGGLQEGCWTLLAGRAYGAPFCDRPLLGPVTKGRAVGPSC